MRAIIVARDSECGAIPAEGRIPESRAKGRALNNVPHPALKDAPASPIGARFTAGAFPFGNAHGRDGFAIAAGQLSALPRS